jgi:hypothetical protein
MKVDELEEALTLKKPIGNNPCVEIPLGQSFTFAQTGSWVGSIANRIEPDFSWAENSRLASFAPNAWRREYQQVPSPGTERQTGRTTRMILAALIEMSEGKDITFLAPTVTIAEHIYRRFCEMADRFRIPYTRIDRGTREENVRGYHPNTRVYYDHTWDEFTR